MTTLPASVHIGLHSGGLFTIRIEDNVSRTIVCEVSLTPDQLARALASHHISDAEMEWYGAPYVGMRCENATHEVRHRLRYADRDDAVAIAAVLQPFEVDGWRGRRDDLFNPHNYVRRPSLPQGELVSRVAFNRYIPTEES